MIRLRDARVVGLLGVGITRSESALHLGRLGFATAERPDGLDVTVPPFRRNDVTREADLIEEVARLHGVNDQLPATLPRRRGAVGLLTAGAASAPPRRGRARRPRPARGRRLELRVRRARRRAAAARRRPAPRARRHRQSDERGRVDHAHDAARLAAGHRASQCRARAERRAGLLRVRARVLRRRRDAAARAPCARRARAGRRLRREGLRRGAAASAAGAGVVRRRAGALPAPGPQRGGRIGSDPARSSAGSATCIRSSPPAGTSTASPPSSSTSAPSSRTPRSFPHYADLTSFPELREDIAIIVDSGVPAATVLDAVRGAGGKLLARAEVFDVYRGEQIPAGRTSLAIALTFRAPRPHADRRRRRARAREDRRAARERARR